MYSFVGKLYFLVKGASLGLVWYYQKSPFLYQSISIFPACSFSKETSMAKPYIASVRNHPPSDPSWILKMPIGEGSLFSQDLTLMELRHRLCFLEQKEDTKLIMCLSISYLGQKAVITDLFKFPFEDNTAEILIEKTNPSSQYPLLPTLCWTSIHYTGWLAYLRMAQCVPSPQGRTITKHINQIVYSDGSCLL